MNKMKIIFFFITFFLSFTCIGQNKPALSKILEINANTFILKYEKGDFNKDGIQDYIVIDSINNGSNDLIEVRIHVYEGRSNNHFIKKCSSGNLTYGFTFNNNPVIKILEKGVISVFHQSMRHDYEFKIAYKNEYKDYIIIGSEYHNYGNGRYSTNVSSNYITQKRIINETIYNNETDRSDKLPARTEKITSKAYSLSSLNDDNVYSFFD